MNKWDIGQEVSLKDYTEVALKCNELGDRHLEKQEDLYVVASNKKVIPTLEEQVRSLEEKYNMPRVVREGILSNPTAYSEFNVTKAQEIEELAEQLRN